MSIPFPHDGRRNQTGTRRALHRIVRRAPFAALAAAIVLLYGCGRKAPQAEAPPPPAGQLPLDLVVLIDNSGSIRPGEQDLVRETTMLLADLADSDDRVSVITFGEGARLAVSALIRSDQDKVAFKKQVTQGVNFRETLSDLRGGLRVLAENRGQVFRPQGSARAAVVLSDGRLEVAGGGVAPAFDELRRTLAGPLAGVDVYAVALGDNRANETVPGLGLTGAALMRDHVARGADRFYHARRLDQLLEMAVLILNRAKGISSLGEPGKARFKTDSTVESLTLIVRKLSTGGESLCRSSEIQLVAPGGETITSQNQASALGGRLYWSSEYQYFDLLIVRQPGPGAWEVKLAGGKAPQVSSRVNTPIELRFGYQARLYLNQASTIAAWLHDRKAGGVSPAPYRMQAHLAADGKLDQSNVYIPMTRTPDGQYVLDAQKDLDSALKRSPGKGAVTLELIAEKWKDAGQTQLDEWFIRRSAPFTIEYVEPFFQWVDRPARLHRFPLRAASRDFGATLDTRHPGYPAYELPPRLTLTVQVFDEGSGAYKPYSQRAVEAVAAGGTLNYPMKAAFEDSGDYRYRYRLEGTTPAGPVVIESPWLPLEVPFLWIAAAGVAVLLLIALSWISARRAKLAGTITVTEPSLRKEVVNPPARRWESSRSRLKEMVGPGHQFAFEARRRFLVSKGVALEMQRGSVVVDGRPLSAGRRLRLASGRPHQIAFVRADNKRVKVTVSLSVCG